ncbi:unnamed protein product [Didymodactylos carnosus]|uniref:F-box domain-containing protein n=1 Tax=Didymodactylos carnosus TaxID=1234261 RepID=A0A813RS63_9BILA|nr:unnamed protein product [Didymodactylos carnosus]CAF0951903.1 unnamed protein product [Didymodactylos carnosus]CAF3570584.1 unnamed protein product [Didymodactylos carnosus]CAF3725956.1 unnamed protein product [Didymodactylos carnosus]
MVTRFEQLASETLYEIFSYLSFPNVLTSFSNLNSTLTSLVNAHHIWINLSNISLTTFDYYCRHILPSRREQIHGLTLSNEQTVSEITLFISIFYLIRFTKLRSLTLIEPTQDEFQHITTTILKLPQLRHLSVTWNDDHKFRQIGPTIFKPILLEIRTLKSCELSFLDTAYFLSSVEQMSSTIQYLTIHRCDIDCLFHVLDYFPQLKSLSIQDRVTAAIKGLTDDAYKRIKETTPASSLTCLKIRVFNVEYLFIEFLIEKCPKLKKLAFSFVGDSGLDFLDNDRWEWIVQSLSFLSVFQLYIEIWDIIESEMEYLNYMVDRFQDQFWTSRGIYFIYDYYHDTTANQLNLIVYTQIYPDIDFSTQWGQLRLPLSPLTTRTTYVNVKTLTLLILNTQQMVDELKQLNSRYYPNVEKLTIKFEKTSGLHQFGSYIDKLIRLSNIKHLNIVDRCHSSATLFEIVRRSPRLCTLTIIQNQKLLKQIFENKLLCLYLKPMIQNLNIMYSSRMTVDLCETICNTFVNLYSFSTSIDLPDDFEDVIPLVVKKLTKLKYFHVLLNEDRYNFQHKDMDKWIKSVTSLKNFRVTVSEDYRTAHIWI